MKKHKGAAMMYVIILAAIIMLFMYLVASLMVTNSKRAIHQLRRSEAYYASTAGIEIGTAAVLQPRIVGGSEISFLEQFEQNPFRIPLKHENIPVGTGDTGSTVSITVQAVDSQGEKWISTSVGDVWVEVISNGMVPNGDNVVTYNGSIRILTTNPAVITRNMAFD